MSHWANLIHQTAMQLVQVGFGTTFKTYRLTPMLQIQPGDLPVLAVHILREKRVPLGDENVGPPKFIHDLTLGFSGAVQVETQEQDQINALEEWMSTLDDILFCDPSFVNLTEGFTAMDRVGQYAKVGETTLFEIRIEMNIRFPSTFEPRIKDVLATVDIKTQVPDGTPPLEQVYKLAALKRTNGSRPPPTEKEP
jgi:hypothetical protein